MIFDEGAVEELAGEHGGRLCPMCEGGPLTARHCKLICESCGYVESCEDNFVPNFANPLHVPPGQSEHER